MDYNELNNLWNNYDSEIENSVTINANLLKEVSISKVRSHLYEIKWNAFIEVFANLIFLFFMLEFIRNHILEIKYLFPALLLLASTFFGMILSIYKLKIYYKIDPQSSILETQKNTEKLRYYDLLGKNMLYIIIPLFSAAFMIVTVKALLGLNLYVLGTWLVLYTLGSFFIAVIVIYFLKKFPNRRLQEASQFLKEIKEMRN